MGRRSSAPVDGFSAEFISTSTLALGRLGLLDPFWPPLQAFSARRLGSHWRGLQKSPLVAGKRGEFARHPAARERVTEALCADGRTQRPRREEIARVAAAGDAAHPDRGNADA